MIDLYFNETGDIQKSSDGDLAQTNTPWRCDVQQAYIRLMTDVGDYTLYPTLGSNLSTLYGQPQSAATGQLGVSLINSSMTRESYFAASNIKVTAVPISRQTIRFDVAITSGSASQIQLSVNQNISLS